MGGGGGVSVTSPSALLQACKVVGSLISEFDFVSSRSVLQLSHLNQFGQAEWTARFKEKKVKATTEGSERFSIMLMFCFCSNKIVITFRISFYIQVFFIVYTINFSTKAHYIHLRE